MTVPYVESHLVNDGWTPEEIAGRLPLDHPGLSTNYESIYQWIYEERRDLIKYLPKAHGKRHKRRHGKKNRASKIPNRVDITERPSDIKGREEAGHWEVDTVVSRQSKVCVAVLVERKTRYYSGFRIEDKSARSMRRCFCTTTAALIWPLTMKRLKKCTVWSHKICQPILGLDSLGYRTPAEVFAKCGGVALAG